MNRVLLTDEENPWTKKSDRVIYDNPWIHVREHQVIDPSGKDTIYGVVSAKHLAIGIIPLDEDYNTWLVGQYRYPLDQYSWEIVAGGGKPDEDPVASGKRELKEETGIKAASWTRIMELQTSNCISDEIAIIYIAKGLSFGESQPDDDELLKVSKVPFEQAYDMVMEGRIGDGISVAGILKTKLLIEQGKV